MARTYKTLSLSLPPEVAKKLSAIGNATGRTGARVAAEIVLREIAKESSPKEEPAESRGAARREWSRSRGRLSSSRRTTSSDDGCR